jgi:hypothetical protein
VAVVQLDVLLAYAAVEGQACVGGAEPGRAGLLVSLVKEEELVYQTEDCEADCEADEGHEHPVVAQPEDDLDVGPVPAVAQVMREEAPGVVVVFVREQNAQAVVALGALVHVVAPDDTEVERTGGCHDGDVGEGPAAVVVGQRVDGLQKERVAGNGAHDIVGDTGGDGAADPGGVGEERVETAVASLESVSCALPIFGSQILRTSSKSM